MGEGSGRRLRPLFRARLQARSGSRSASRCRSRGLGCGPTLAAPAYGPRRLGSSVATILSTASVGHLADFILGFLPSHDEPLERWLADLFEGLF
jgi:hypothetical protein